MELTVENVKEYIGAVLSEEEEDLKPRGQKLKITKMADFLLAELDRIEKQTAEKCVEIAGDTAPEYIAAYIMHHFNLKEKP